jgi:ABC-2 type transport system permease protein
VSALPDAPGAGRLTGSAGAPHPAPAAGAVTLGRVLRSEWTKLWSLRSTRWSLAVAFLTQAGLGPLFALLEMGRWNHLSLAQRLFFSPIDHALVGFHFSQLAIAVLGVLIITGEYSTGQIRSTLLAVPRRLPVLWAKLIVFSTVTFLLIFSSALIAFFVSNAIFTEHHVNVGLGAPHAFRAVLGTALYVTGTGMLCTAFGTMLRATAGGISAFVVILFVLPPILFLLPTGTANAINPYLPSVAGGTVGSALLSPHSFSPWGGFALFCAYVIAAILAAAWLLKGRDA